MINGEKMNVWMNVVDVVLFSCLLVLDVFITVKFLILEKKGKIVFVSAFYVLTMILCVSRIVFFIASFDENNECGCVKTIAHNVAFYSMVGIDLLQICQLVELGIHVKLSAEEIEEPKAKKQICYVTTVLLLAMVFYLGLGVFETTNTVEKDDFDDKILIHPLVLLSLSIALTCAYMYLYMNMKRYFAEEMKDEERRVNTIYIVFTIACISRAVIDFFEDPIDDQVFSVMYIFWEVIPLCLIMAYHYKCFSAQVKSLNELNDTQESRELF